MQQTVDGSCNTDVPELCCGPKTFQLLFSVSDFDIM